MVSVGGPSLPSKSEKIIRLILRGCTNRPFFHICVQEGNRTKNEPIIEQLGNYDPLPNIHNEKLVSINFQRLEHWIKEGAVITNPVQKLLGLSGYFPIHYMTLQDSWNNKKLIKTRLDELKLAVAEIQNKKSTETESDSVTTSSNSANDSNLPPESSDKVS